MLSRKKLFRIRLIAFFSALLLFVAIFYTVSAITTSSQKKMMQMPTLTTDSAYRVATVDAADPSRFSDQNPLESKYLRKVAEDDTLILYEHTGFRGIQVYDKRTGQKWSSYVEDEKIIQDMAGSIAKMMTSLFSITYIDLTTSVSTATGTTIYSCDLNPPLEEDEEKEETAEESTEEITGKNGDAPLNITTEKIFGGVRWTYTLQEQNMQFSIDMFLDNGALVVNVPDELIKEKEDSLGDTEKIKQEMNAKIGQIRNICNSVISSVGRQGLRESVEKSITLKLQETTKLLTEISETAGTTKFKEDSIEQLKKYIGQAITQMQKSNAKDSDIAQLEQVLEMATEIYNEAVVLNKSRGTGILRMTLFPYFGAQTFGTDGYVFYPDNSGALSYFTVNHPLMSGTYSADVYGSYGDIVGQNTEWDDDETPSPVTMPVFGIKAGNSAFVAIVTEGDTDCAINFLPCASDRPIGNAYASFYLRKTTTMVNANGNHTIIYDPIRTKQNWEVRYEFLAGEDANYAGMAINYRTYLEKSGQLKASPLMEKDTVPVAFDLCMGRFSDQQTLFTKFITLTRFSDVQEFLEKLEQAGVTNTYVSLWEWMSEETFANNDYKVNGAIGGKSDLRKLSDYVKGKGGLLSLEIGHTWRNSDDISGAQRSVGSIKAKSQMIRNMGDFVAMNPVYSLNNFLTRTVSKLQDYGVNGVYHQRDLTPVYDYNQYAPLERSNSTKVWQYVAQKTQEQIGYMVYESAPQYLMNVTDWTPYVKEEGKGYLYEDESVPFYQIVLHGSIVYTGTPLNSLPNVTRQTLKFIEFGYVPFYQLTHDDPFELTMNGIKHHFYSTMMDDWFDRIVEMHKQYQEDFHDVWNVKISNHESLSADVKKTTYENGVKVYVNYSGSVQTFEGVTIEAESYKVVR